MTRYIRTLALAALLFSSAAFGQQAFNRFQPANGVLKGSTSTYVTTPALSSDIIAMWTGTCTGTNVLQANGVCGAGGGGSSLPAGFSFSGTANAQLVFGSPYYPGHQAQLDFTCTVGCTAWRTNIRGDEIYFDDGTNTITSGGNTLRTQTTFTQLVHFTQHTHIQSPNGELFFTDPSGPFNQKEWGVEALDPQLNFHTNTDNSGAPTTNWLTVTRSGTDIASVLLSGPLTVANATSTSGVALTATGVAGHYAATLQGNTTGGQSHGLLIQAGVQFNDDSLVIKDATGATTYAKMSGSGTLILGNPAGGSVNGGDINATGIYEDGVAIGAGLGGSQFGVTGCSATNKRGGSVAGDFQSGSSATCTFVITPGASGANPPHGWACFATDITTATNLAQTTPSSVTACSVVGAVSTNDVIVFKAVGY